jgi:hypothetical protein
MGLTYEPTELGKLQSSLFFLITSRRRKIARHRSLLVLASWCCVRPLFDRLGADQVARYLADSAP